jgi:HlyD family secretion protein
MEQDHLRQLIRSLRDLSESEAALSDARLLERFVAQQDQAAFELLWRHGPLVLGVCRRTLANRHDAEDAFQATFLTLFQKARSISSAAALGSWLYRVASRIALKLRAKGARSAKREQPLPEELPAPGGIDSDHLDVHRAIDEEINRLPARQRDAFILCCLQGKTRDEAARELGCPGGTVSSRLTRARELLRRRLTRRGLAPAAVVSAVLAGESLAAPVSPGLVEANLKALLLFSSGGALCSAFCAEQNSAQGALSVEAVRLAQGMVRAMFVKKVKFAALVLLVVGALVGAGFLGRHALEAAHGRTTPTFPLGPKGRKPAARKRNR